MTAPILAPPVKWWECPSCGRQESTQVALPHAPFHPCSKLGGALVPSVEVRTNAGLAVGAVRHVVNEREDYIGPEIGLRYVDGRPVMSVTTERADGSNDCAVFPGTARASVEG